MSDEADFYGRGMIDSLYGHRYYINPKRQPWQPWYAWYPVYVIEWRTCDGIGLPFKVSRLTWLNTIMRRTVVDHLIGSSWTTKYNEYTTVEEMLKHA